MRQHEQIRESACSPRAVGTSRRGFLGAVTSAMAASLTGCVFKRCELAADTPTPDLIAHLNHNIAQIDSWRCDKVLIKLHGAPIIMPSLTAKMAIEKPRNFRLQASMPIGGGDVVDLGSNEDRFWFWAKDDQQPQIVTARHERLQEAQRSLPMPFEPEWLIETLGLVSLDENEIEVEKHPGNPKQCFFRRKRRAPDGSRVELVSTVDICQGVIVDHSLSDRNGNMIALAHLDEHERDGKSGVVLAHTVELSWPQAHIGLKLRMGAIEVNPTTIPSKQFTMPQIANCRVLDIGGDDREEIETVSGEAGKAEV